MSLEPGKCISSCDDDSLPIPTPPAVTLSQQPGCSVICVTPAVIPISPGTRATQQTAINVTQQAFNMVRNSPAGNIRMNIPLSTVQSMLKSGTVQSTTSHPQQQPTQVGTTNSSAAAPKQMIAKNFKKEMNLCDAETYADYMLIKLKIGRKHPTPVVETAYLASVPPPDVTYKLKLPFGPSTGSRNVLVSAARKDPSRWFPSRLSYRRRRWCGQRPYSLWHHLRELPARS